MTTGTLLPWPDVYLGAVSLTFDDGRASQLQKGIPILAEHDLRATFYLNPQGDDWLEALTPWREVARARHEIGNHTIGHPCSKALFDDPKLRCLESMTLAEIEADIVEASRRLREGIPEQTEFSFCYPCYQEHIGEGLTRQSYVPVVARHFIAGRGQGERGHNIPAACDLAYLYSWKAEFLTAPTLVGMAEQAATLGRWTIFTIHGIDDGHLPLSEVAFRELCGFLARQRTRIWTAPVIEVAKRIVAWREKIANHRVE